jgi:hypothetical protein
LGAVLGWNANNRYPAAASLPNLLAASLFLPLIRAFFLAIQQFFDVLYRLKRVRKPPAPENIVLMLN